MADSDSQTIPNPPSLPARYQIHKLTAIHIPWVTALLTHANIFESPLWSVAYPTDQIQRAYKTFLGTDYLSRHNIESGLSYGIFDTEYVFRHPETVARSGRPQATGPPPLHETGQLYWDVTDLSATRQTLLEQMDFPLVSVALSHDAMHPLDSAQLAPWVAALPLLADIGRGLSEATAWMRSGPGGVEEAGKWFKPVGEGEVLLRSGTATREDYADKHLMSTLARWIMDMARDKGFRAIGITCVHDALLRVWAHPPEPYRGEVVGEIDPEVYEREDAEGKMIRPFLPAKQHVWKVLLRTMVES